jgi:nucleotide-binding universal stress UspA family protein
MNVDDVMPMTRRVVVGVDGSEPSKRALRWAAYLAQSMHASIEAVIAWNLGAAAYAPYPSNWDPADDARITIDHTLDSVFGAQHHPADLKVTVLEGYPPKVLLDVSADADMLVIGSRGHGGFAGLLLGSVSAACTEHATCPVLVTHGTTPEPPNTGHSPAQLVAPASPGHQSTDRGTRHDH